MNLRSATHVATYCIALALFLNLALFAAQYVIYAPQMGEGLVNFLLMSGMSTFAEIVKCLGLILFLAAVRRSLGPDA